jgi:hypothetical protein
MLASLFATVGSNAPPTTLPAGASAGTVAPTSASSTTKPSVSYTNTAWSSPFGVLIATGLPPAVITFAPGWGGLRYLRP